MDTSRKNCPVLQALCALNNTLNDHLQLRTFNDPYLEQLLPTSVELSIKDADLYIPVETADPVITYKRGDIATAPIVAKGHDKGAQQVQLGTSMTYTVSTINKALTESICMELLSVLLSMSRALQTRGCFIKNVNISAIQHTHEGHADYFIATVSAGIESGVWWKRDLPTTILREIGVSLNDTNHN